MVKNFQLYLTLYHYFPRFYSVPLICPLLPFHPIPFHRFSGTASPFPLPPPSLPVYSLISSPAYHHLLSPHPIFSPIHPIFPPHHHHWIFLVSRLTPNFQPHRLFNPTKTFTYPTHAPTRKYCHIGHSYPTQARTHPHANIVASPAHFGDILEKVMKLWVYRNVRGK